MELDVQTLIDSGTAWLLEGHVGRQCMAAIENGDAVLGPTRNRDYWGSTVPSRFDVQEGTKGSQLYAHQQQGHELPYARCRRGTCSLPRRTLRETQP